MALAGSGSLRSRCQVREACVSFCTAQTRQAAGLQRALRCCAKRWSWKADRICTTNPRKVGKAAEDPQKPSSQATSRTRHRFPTREPARAIVFSKQSRPPPYFFVRKDSLPPACRHKSKKQGRPQTGAALASIVKLENHRPSRVRGCQRVVVSPMRQDRASFQISFSLQVSLALMSAGFRVS